MKIGTYKSHQQEFLDEQGYIYNLKSFHTERTGYIQSITQNQEWQWTSQQPQWSNAFRILQHSDSSLAMNKLLRQNKKFSEIQDFKSFTAHTFFLRKLLKGCGPSKQRTKPRKKKMWVPEKGVQSRKITKTNPLTQMAVQKSQRVSSTIHVYVLHICGLNQLQIKNIWEKTSKKQNLNSVYTVFTTIYVVFTLYQIL